MMATECSPTTSTARTTSPWCSPACGHAGRIARIARSESCTIITGEPNELVAQIHNRMPVILESARCDEWLESDDRPSLEGLLSPIPAQLLAAYPISTAVNKPSQGGPGLIEPLGD